MITSFRRFYYVAFVGLFAGVPFISQAAFACTPGIRNFLCRFMDLIGLATGILAALALLVFFWGLVKYIAKADDEKAKAAGKNTMIYGVIGLFVMFSVFGIVRFLQSSFGIDAGNNSAPDVPEVIFTP